MNLREIELLDSRNPDKGATAFRRDTLAFQNVEASAFLKDLNERFMPVAALLSAGKGVAIVIKGHDAKIIGLEETPTKEKSNVEAKEQMALMPIESAPRDGTPVLARFERNLPEACSEFSEITAVLRDRGDGSSWCFAAPVGHGGFPDEFLAGWFPLPGYGQSQIVNGEE